MVIKHFVYELKRSFKRPFLTIFTWKFEFSKFSLIVPPNFCSGNFCTETVLIILFVIFVSWLPDSWLSLLFNMGSNDKVAPAKFLLRNPKRSQKQVTTQKLPARPKQLSVCRAVHRAGGCSPLGLSFFPFPDFPHSLAHCLLLTDSPHLRLLFLTQSSHFFPKHDTAHKIEKCIEYINVKLGAKS